LSPETCRVTPLLIKKRNCCILLDLFHHYKAWCTEPQILKTVNMLIVYIFKTYFNIILVSTSRYLNSSLPFKFLISFS